MSLLVPQTARNLVGRLALGGRYCEASAVLNNEVNLRACRTADIVRMALSLRLMGHGEAGQELLQTVTQRGTNDPFVYVELGRNSGERGDFSNARAAYQQASDRVRGRPHPAMLCAQAALECHEGNFDGARELLSQAGSWRLSMSGVLRERIALELAAGDAQAAWRVAGGLIERDRTYVENYECVADAALAAEKYRDGMAIIEGGLTISRTRDFLIPDLVVRYVELCVATGCYAQVQERLADASAALARRGIFHIDLFLLAGLHCRNTDAFDDALARLHSAIQCWPLPDSIDSDLATMVAREDFPALGIWRQQHAHDQAAYFLHDGPREQRWFPSAHLTISTRSSHV